MGGGKVMYTFKFADTYYDADYMNDLEKLLLVTETCKWTGFLIYCIWPQKAELYCLAKANSSNCLFVK